MLTTFLWLAAFLLFVWITLACYLGRSWVFRHRAWERNPKREAVYREYGQPAPPRASGLQMAGAMLSCLPLLLIGSFLWIFSLLFTLLFMSWCYVTGRKPGGTLPPPTRP